jgi:hypothetical protein
MGKLIIILAVIAIVIIAMRNNRKKKQWETEFKYLKIEVSLMNYNPESFPALKSKFDDLMNRSEQDSEAIHILWKEFVHKYWREYSELIVNEK